jgi:hypothetical protein
MDEWSELCPKIERLARDPRNAFAHIRRIFHAIGLQEQSLIRIMICRSQKWVRGILFATYWPPAIPLLR